MFSKKFYIFQIIFAVAFAALIFMRSIQFNQKTELPVIGHVADFALTNADEKHISYHDLKGNIWVADFMFTTCGNICPMMTRNMAKLHQMFKLVEDVRLVSFSVNPENDTPEVLLAYAKKYNADTSRWFFLTGTNEQVKDIAVNSFKLGDIKEPVFHSPSFVLVDRKGNIRGYYEGTEEKSVQQIAQDIRTLLMER